MYDTQAAKAQRVLMAMIRNTSEKYYLKLKMIRFHLHIQKVQQYIRNSAKKKRGRERAMLQAYNDYVLKLEEINNPLLADGKNDQGARKR